MSDLHFPTFLPDQTHECAECGCPAAGDLPGLSHLIAAMEAAWQETNRLEVPFDTTFEVFAPFVLRNLRQRAAALGGFDDG